MLCTLADVKNFLGVSETTYDTRLEMIMAGIDRQIKDYCGKPFEKATITDEPIKFTWSVGYVANTPLISVTEIKELDEDITTTLEGFIAEVEPLTGKVQLDYLTSREYLITYEGGYEAEDIPANIKLAFYKWVEFEFNNSTGIRTFKSTGVTSTIEDTIDGIPSSVKSLLDTQRHWRT